VIRSRIYIVLTVIAAVLALSGAAIGQSSDQSFPTRVRSNEIVGTIKARDIGDARLTTYYYEFGGEQGDIFVNVVTKNFDGDIDIFTVDGLRPLSKIVIFADAAASETGRIIYLRKFERLLLRVQGRTPDDSPATFRIKFAGSFLADRSSAGDDEVKAPVLNDAASGDVRVNSVGTIIEKPPAPKPPVVAKKEAPAVAKPKESDAGKASKPAAKSTAKSDSAKKPEPAKPGKEVAERSDKDKSTAAGKEADDRETAVPGVVRLTILFKDGNKIVRAMSDVLRFSMDNGILTVILKSGFIGRYSMAAIGKISVE